ncbi:MAG: GNAT family N-acetyltransferase [Chitinophagales bacterium]|nr:GNAT family N-acetyltransferase [Chitinophagales bacterium]
MEIKIENLTLRKMVHADIELVRRYRNDNQNNKFLINKKYISREQQEKWFASIDWRKELYWLIEFDEEKRGLIYINNWNKITNSAETNIFIFNKIDSGSPNFIKSLYLITDYCFNQLKITTLFSKIHQDNLAALEVDLFLGFEKYAKRNKLFFLKCTKTSFLKNSARVNSLFFNT